LFPVLTPLLIRGWPPLAADIHPWWWLLYEEAEKSSASPFCKKKSETRENSSLMKHTAGTRIWGSSDWRFGYRGQCWKYSSEPGHGSYCPWLQVPCSPPWWCCHWKGQSCIWCLTSWIFQMPLWFVGSEGLGFRLDLIWIFSAFVSKFCVSMSLCNKLVPSQIQRGIMPMFLIRILFEHFITGPPASFLYSSALW
jgi:hypothetical protein